MLESTIVCVDNTEYSRNQDFTPHRLGAQQDIVQTIMRAKLRMNPENNVGLIAVGGTSPTFVNTLTSDTSRLLSKFAAVTFSGTLNNFSTSLKIAHLGLKHRTSKNHRQRIVICVCTPLKETEAELVKAAKKLKKENVNVDVINFGEDESNVELLAKFIETLNGKSTEPQCNLVNVPKGSNLNDAVRMSRICGQEATPATAGGMENDGGMDWDDPNMDPDLALALRVSLEESRARQQQEANATGAEVPATIPEESAAATAEDAAEDALAAAMDGDDAELMEALAMSLDPGNAAETSEEVDYENMTEEEQIQFALKMSMQENEKGDDDDMAE